MVYAVRSTQELQIGVSEAIDTNQITVEIEDSTPTGPRMSRVYHGIVELTLCPVRSAVLGNCVTYQISKMEVHTWYLNLCRSTIYQDGLSPTWGSLEVEG